MPIHLDSRSCGVVLGNPGEPSHLSGGESCNPNLFRGTLRGGRTGKLLVPQVLGVLSESTKTYIPHSIVSDPPSVRPVRPGQKIPDSSVY
jgi:hypothetical protein